MKPRTEIVNHKIVNWVEQLASFLKSGDVFRKPRSTTQYKFQKLLTDRKMVICENMETHIDEEIYYNSPVFKLMAL